LTAGYYAASAAAVIEHRIFERMIMFGELRKVDSGHVVFEGKISAFPWRE
jgi:hypothetical protein